MLFDDDRVKWMRIGRVCQRAHALLDADSTLRIGRAIAKAAAQLDVTLSNEVESGMVLALTRIVLAGGDVAKAARDVGVVLDEN